MATSIANMTYLRAQIKGTYLFAQVDSTTSTNASPENVLFIHPNLGEPNISIATHDNLFWVLVEHKNNGWLWNSAKGFESDEAALQAMLKSLSAQVWQKAKERNLTLPK
ncbi:hypothetical protein KCU95_g3807, partial [Aureobasidium melanogenum]